MSDLSMDAKLSELGDVLASGNPGMTSNETHLYSFMLGIDLAERFPEIGQRIRERAARGPNAIRFVEKIAIFIETGERP